MHLKQKGFQSIIRYKLSQNRTMHREQKLKKRIELFLLWSFYPFLFIVNLYKFVYNYQNFFSNFLITINYILFLRNVKNISSISLSFNRLNYLKFLHRTNHFSCITDSTIQNLHNFFPSKDLILI